MKLSEFMKEERWTVALIAKELNVPEPTVVKWKYNEAIPRKQHVLQIYKFTKGKVTPNDFYFSTIK